MSVMDKLLSIASGQGLGGHPVKMGGEVAPATQPAQPQGGEAQAPVSSGGWPEEMPANEAYAAQEGPGWVGDGAEAAEVPDEPVGEASLGGESDAPLSPWAQSKAKISELTQANQRLQEQVDRIPQLVRQAVEDLRGQAEAQGRVQEDAQAWAREVQAYRAEALMMAEQARSQAMQLGHDGDAAYLDYLRQADEHLAVEQDKRQRAAFERREDEFNAQLEQRRRQAEVEAFKASAPDYGDLMDFLGSDATPFMKVMRGEATPADLYALAKLVKQGHAGTPNGIEELAEARAKALMAERVVGAPQAPGRVPPRAPAGGWIGPQVVSGKPSFGDFLRSDAARGLSPAQRLAAITSGKVAIG